MNKKPSRLVKILKRTTIALISLAALLFLMVWYMSPGATSPIVDARGQVMPNSIASGPLPAPGRVCCF